MEAKQGLVIRKATDDFCRRSEVRLSSQWSERLRQHARSTVQGYLHTALRRIIPSRRPQPHAANWRLPPTRLELTISCSL
jgi:hypothetical protein